MMIRQAIQPPDYMPSIYGNQPVMRAADLPGMTSVEVTDLFPNMVPRIYRQNEDVTAIRNATRKALEGVNMDMIKKNDTINLCCSEHGFCIMGGEAYVEMLKTIKEVVEERTGNKNIRLRIGVYIGYHEADEVIEYYHLKELFDGKVLGLGPFDKGVPIETEIGTLYGIQKIYDADWFIHGYYDDPREMYGHRMIYRCLKAFCMDYARFETRSASHLTFGVRSAWIIPKAIFDSPFVQQKFAFACFMRTAPSGVHAIDADNDLYQIDKRVTISHLRHYGKMRELLAAIDECIAVLDGGRWAYYVQTAGTIFGVLMNADYDPFDLSNPATSRFQEALDNYQGGKMDDLMRMPDSLKAVVINQSWKGLIIHFIPHFTPTFVVGKEQAEMYRKDSANPFMMDLARTADTLEEAMAEAYKVAGTDKVILFDGSFGNINCSPSMAEVLKNKAPEVHRRVEEELLPKWFKQRGINPDDVIM
jgi:hypothetical protein